MSIMVDGKLEVWSDLPVLNSRTALSKSVSMAESSEPMFGR